jgi:hypothetical protein
MSKKRVRTSIGRLTEHVLSEFTYTNFGLTENAGYMEKKKILTFYVHNIHILCYCPVLILKKFRS